MNKSPWAQVGRAIMQKDFKEAVASITTKESLGFLAETAFSHSAKTLAVTAAAMKGTFQAGKEFRKVFDEIVHPKPVKQEDPIVSVPAWSASIIGKDDEVLDTLHVNEVGGYVLQDMEVPAKPNLIVDRLEFSWSPETMKQSEAQELGYKILSAEEINRDQSETIFLLEHLTKSVAPEPTKPTTYKDLQAQCKEHGLSAKGSAEQLKNRLQELKP